MCLLAAREALEGAGHLGAAGAVSGEIADFGVSVGSTTGGMLEGEEAVLQAALALIVAFYFLVDGARFRDVAVGLFPIEYRKVPASTLDGEQTASTQPFPVKPPPFARQTFTEDMVTNRTPEAHAAVLESLRKLDSKGMFTPPSTRGTVLMPGTDGLALTRKLKGDPATRDIVIVAVTAYAMKGDHERALDAGCDDYVTKPIDTDTLPKIVAAHLSRQG